MKQYEILWVEVDVDSSKKSTRIETQCGTLDAIENAIVMSVEEAKEIWDAAQESAANVEFGHYAENFYQYIQSKGIQTK